MGVIGRVLGAGGAVRDIGAAVGGVAEVFVGNRAEREAQASQQFVAAVGAYGAEFAGTGGGRFDRFVNALNRLPRPMLALSTLGLFAYAMAEPAGFSVRMQGLALVPEPLWWLLGAIVSFYFGARELHHQRTRGLTPAMGPVVPAREAAAGETAVAQPLLGVAAGRSAAVDPDHNAAVEEWRALRR